MPTTIRHPVRLLVFAAALCWFAPCAPAQNEPARPAKDLSQASPLIHWPEGLDPKDADVFVHNETEIHAPPAVVWENLVDAVQWPTWYANSAEVKLLEPGQTKLEENSRFTWRTFNLPVESQVRDFVPDKLLAWSGKGQTAQGYHVWLIIEKPDGCLVVTEETQKGPGAVKRSIEQPRAQYDAHDWWLSALKARSEKAAASPR